MDGCTVSNASNSHCLVALKLEGFPRYMRFDGCPRTMKTFSHPPLKCSVETTVTDGGQLKYMRLLWKQSSKRYWRTNGHSLSRNRSYELTWNSICNCMVLDGGINVKSECKLTRVHPISGIEIIPSHPSNVPITARALVVQVCWSDFKPFAQGRRVLTCPTIELRPPNIVLAEIIVFYYRCNSRMRGFSTAQM